MDDVILFALPVFGVLMAAEFAWGLARGRNNYGLADTLASLSQGLLSQVVAACTQLIQIGLYTLAWPFLTLTPHAALWQHWGGVALAVLLYDFCDYWLHRVSHESALFWAAHVVHHQSEEYNLSTALRQTGSGWLAGWLFYLPMAVVGVPPPVFAVVALIDLLYQFWVHTRQIDRLGWFDRWFCAPSNHRVHHAVDDVYLDRNYGGILVVWDRLFGSFQPELDETPCHYGTRSPLRSWNPVWANLEVYAALWHDCRHAAGWGDKLRVWFKPPGWRPADVAQRFPKGAFVPGAIPRYAPALSPARRNAATATFAAAIGVTCVVLWNAHRLAPLQLAGASACVLAMLWLVGWISERVEATAEAPQTA